MANLHFRLVKLDGLKQFDAFHIESFHLAG